MASKKNTISLRQTRINCEKNIRRYILRKPTSFNNVLRMNEILSTNNITYLVTHVGAEFSAANDIRRRFFFFKKDFPFASCSKTSFSPFSFLCVMNTQYSAQSNISLRINRAAEWQQIKSTKLFQNFFVRKTNLSIVKWYLGID